MAFDAYAKHLPLRKGAKNYVDYLHKTGAKTVLITTLSKSLCVAALKRTDLYDYFDLMIFGEDLESNAKNSPKTYVDLAKRIGVKPSDCTVFEDSDAALKSARLSGMKICEVVDLMNGDFDFAPKVLNKGLK